MTNINNLHLREPFYNWQGIYLTEKDERYPFFTPSSNNDKTFKTIYNFCIHPEWDDFGSETLFIKLLYVNNEENVAILEFIGEWNDALGNDIMFLWENVLTN